MSPNQIATLPAGKMLSLRYKVIKKLGEGGYGAVYLAEDIRLGDKKVAIKELLDATSESQALFANEARLLASLNHPGLVKVSDFFSEGHSYYLVMDYIEGQDLLDLISDAEMKGIMLPYDLVMEWMTQLCESVGYIHQRTPPIVHRDIKPGNVRLNSSGNAILVDFGIAKADPKAKTVRMAKAVSLGFSPPEQYGSDSGTDTRSDVYALAATMYCLLTIQLPTDSSERLINSLELPPPSQFNPIIPKKLDGIILKAMSLDSLQRYQNAVEILDALNTIQQKHVLASGKKLSPIAPHPTQAAILCINCCTPLRPGARFCPKCGINQTASSASKNTCPKCHTPTRAGAHFCPQCRTALTPSIFPLANPVWAASQMFAAVVPSLTPGTPAFQQAQLAFIQARKAFQDEHYQVAAISYEKALLAGMQLAQIYADLGKCYLELKRVNEAIQLLESGAQRFSKDSDIQHILALAHASTGHIPKAISLLETAQRLDPDNEKIIHLLVLLYREMRLFALVVPILEAQLRKHPFDNNLAIELAYAQLMNGQLKNAETLANSLRRQMPSDHEAAFLMGMVHFKSKNLRHALNDFQQAARLKPDSHIAFYFMGEVYLEQKKYHEALRSYQLAANIHYQDVDVHARMFLALIALNRHQEAAAELAIAQKIDPHNALVREILKNIQPE